MSSSTTVLVILTGGRHDSNMELPDDIDPRLRVVLKKGGVVYLTGNSHTRRGRMSAFDEAIGRDISVTKEEIAEATDLAWAWVDGFLAGSEPPVGDTLTEAEEARWYAAREYYRQSGAELREQ